MQVHNTYIYIYLNATLKQGQTQFLSLCQACIVYRWAFVIAYIIELLRIRDGLISRDTPPNTWPQYVDMGIGHEGKKNLPKMVEMGRCYRFVSAS